MTTSDVQSSGPPWTILTILQWTVEYFKQYGIENPRSDTEILLAHVLDCERIDLYLRHDQPLNSEELARFKKCLKRRAQREPVAYIIGIKEFWSLDFSVTADVLIPRPETEGLVETALKLFSETRTINALELGTGSGIISIALAHERHDWNIRATDISDKAIGIARLNARRHQLEEHIRWEVGNWFDPVEKQLAYFDLIISNPPYIRTADMLTLEPEIREFEPQNALNGGTDGLTCLGQIIKTAPKYLKPGGWLLLEIGFDQAEEVRALAHQSGRYDRAEIQKDYADMDRVALFKRNKNQ